MTTLLAVALLGQHADQISIHFARTSAKAPPLSISSKSAFKVSIFNGTKNPVTLLQETCSWGYEMVSFEAMDPAGHTSNITRKPKAWDKNYPKESIVESTGFSLRSIYFGDGTWQGFPAGVGGTKHGWYVRVKLTVEHDKPLLTKKGFWIGSIASKWTEATLE